MLYTVELTLHSAIEEDNHNQEFRREGWTEKRSVVHFCLGSGLFGSYNSD